MKLIKISGGEIYTYYEDDDEIAGKSTLEIADGIDKAFQKSKVRPDFNKEYSHFSLVGDEVAGGVMHSWSIDKQENVATYSFDVAVLPEYRGNLRVGINLIDEAINNYSNEKMMYEDMGYNCQMRLWVINPKLVRFLERHRGFESEGEYPSGEANMIRYE